MAFPVDWTDAPAAVRRVCLSGVADSAMRRQKVDASAAQKKTPAEAGV